MVDAVLCLCHFKNLSDQAPALLSPVFVKPCEAPGRSVRQLLSDGSVTKDRTHRTSPSADTLINTYVGTALFAAHRLCSLSVPAGGTRSYCRGESMSFPRALPMLWVIPIKTGLSFRAVNLAFFFWLLILEHCIFLSSSCHNDQTLTLVLVFCSTEKTLTVGGVLQ